MVPLSYNACVWAQSLFALCMSHETFLWYYFNVFAILIKAHYTVESVAVKVEINTMSVVLGMGEISQCKAHISDAARVVFIQLFTASYVYPCNCYCAGKLCKTNQNVNELLH